MQMNWHGSAMESVSDDDEASDEIKFDGTAKQSFRQRCRVDAGASVAQCFSRRMAEVDGKTIGNVLAAAG